MASRATTARGRSIGERHGRQRTHFTFGVFLSPLLWFGVGRTLPRAPIVFTLSRIPILIDSILSILVLAALGMSIFSQKPQRYLVLTGGLIALLAALDQTRLQPWVFQYAVMLSVLAFRSESR